MKRYLLAVLLAVLLAPINSISLERFRGEALHYRLEWSPIGFGIKAGQARLWCRQANDNGFLLGFHGYSVLPVKLFYPLDNRAETILDKDSRVKKITYWRSVTESWEVNYKANRVIRIIEPWKIDTLAIDDRRPLDALSAIYLLRERKLAEEDSFTLQIIGKDLQGKTAWKPAQIKVIGLETIKIQGAEISCWRVRINIDPNDNLFPGGEIHLWVTNDGLAIPVKVQAEVILFGFNSTVYGYLTSP